MIRDVVEQATFLTASITPALAPAANSPLAMIMGSLMAPGLVTGIVEQQSVATITANVDRQTEGANDILLDQAAEMAAALVQETIAVARGTVVPLEMKGAVALEAIVNEEMAKRTSVAVVTPVFRDAIWESPTLIKMVEMYKDEAIRKLGVIDALGSAAINVDALLSYGPPSLTRELREVAEAVGPELIGQYIRQAMGAGQMTGNVRVDFAEDLRSFSANERRRAMLFVWHAAKAIADGKLADIVDLEGITEANQDKVREFALVLVPGLAARINDEMRSIERAKRRGDAGIRYENEVMFAPTDGRPAYRWKVEIDGAMYNAALAEGLVPEALLGSLVGPKYETLEEIVSNVDYLVKVYERWNATVQETARLARLEAFRAALYTVVGGLVAEIDKEHAVEDYAVYDRRLKRVVNEVNRYDTGEYLAAVRHALCYTAFAHTDVEEFLNHIDLHGRQNPGMDPRECARLAAEDIMINMLASQVVFVDQNRINAVNSVNGN